MKVILVDDELKFVSMLARRLVLRGFEADVAVSGAEAVEKVSKTPYEVAVLDVKMPKMSGFQLKQLLLEINSDLKVIFVTGHGSLGGNGNGFQPEKGEIFLSKPLNLETLIQSIKSVCKDG